MTSPPVDAERKIDVVNKEGALAHATVGIAMGAAGSDVALETADVALMADDLNQLPFAVGLSRQRHRLRGASMSAYVGINPSSLPPLPLLARARC